MTTAGLLQVPVLPGLPILGSLPAFRNNRLGLLQQTAELGPRASFRLGPRPLYMFNDPADMHAILVEHADQIEQIPAMVEMLRPMLGLGLITAPKALHRPQRRRLAPVFQSRRIANYADTMLAHTHDFVDSLRAGSTVDLYSELTRLTLRIIGATLFGRQVLDIAPVVSAALTTVLHHINQKWSRDALLPLPDSWPLPANRRYQAALQQLDQIITRMIDERRATGAGAHVDLLDMLLSARLEETGEPMSEQQVRDEAMTLFLAGHETTANAVSWAWDLLLRHPHVLARMRSEIDGVLGDQPLAYTHIGQMPYTLAAIKEVLRIYPSVYIISRYAIEPFQLPDQTQIHPGTILIMSPYTLHRRADLFPNPDQFDPERFLGAQEQERPRGWYIPFGLGPHSCIGHHFAMLEAQIILVAMIRALDLTLVTPRPARPEPLIALRPRDPILVRVARRGA